MSILRGHREGERNPLQHVVAELVRVGVAQVASHELVVVVDRLAVVRNLPLVEDTIVIVLLLLFAQILWHVRVRQPTHYPLERKHRFLVSGGYGSRPSEGSVCCLGSCSSALCRLCYGKVLSA